MNNDEITKLAREYAEENGDDTAIFIGVCNVLRWLLRTHCIVRKSLVMEEYSDASTDIEESIKYNMRISEVMIGKKELLESLFGAETFKNEEV